MSPDDTETPKNQDRPEAAPSAPGAKADRQARLNEALRANLRKRKDQARKRSGKGAGGATGGDEPAGAPEKDTDSA